MFIKLTGHKDQSSIWIRFEIVIGMVRVPFDESAPEHTGLIIEVDKPAIGVMETPEQIMEMIEKQKVAVPTNGGYGSTGASNLPHCGAGGRVEILNSSIGVNEK